MRGLQRASLRIDYRGSSLERGGIFFFEEENLERGVLGKYRKPKESKIEAKRWNEQELWKKGIDKSNYLCFGGALR